MSALGSCTVKYNNTITVQVVCLSHESDPHEFDWEDEMPSVAVHKSLVLVPCTGHYMVHMSVLDFSP